jgi:tetratricopeptide (TPR) repeat protein/GGDEF domain-containing protein
VLHFYTSPDDFVSAAQSAVAAAVPSHPTSIMVIEVDPTDATNGAASLTSSAMDVVREIVRHSLRDDDSLGMIGDRVVVMLANTNAEEARSIGERLCAVVRTHTFANGQGQVTLSIGAAAAPEHSTTYEGVSTAALGALVRIRAQGRDGAAAAPLPHRDALHRPLAIDRLAGRVEELASLSKWLDEACAGHPRVASVFGETGTGTATLLRQLESEVRLRGGMFAMASSSNLSIGKPYGVWRALLAATNRFPSSPERQWHELHNLEPSLGTHDGVEHTGSQYRLFGELADYVRSLAAARPLVIVLDEMQWADATSWDALEHVLTHLDTDRLMICLAHRPDSAFDTSPHRQMLKRHNIVRELTLSRLTREEVKQWLEAAFHRQQVGREFLAFLYRHTEGNPLFIAQSLRALVEQGAIWHNGLRWEWTPVSELRLPPSRAALIAQRLSRFSSSTQAVLATAAVIGREFDVELVVTAGAGSEPAVKLALSEALTAGLLRPSLERREGSYAFAHDEIAQVLVDPLPREQRRQLHQRVGRALAKRRPDRPGEIALHFDAAGDAAEAYRWGQVAAKDAERVYANAAAGSYLQLSGRNATTPAELAEIRVALAQLAETGGRFDEVEELCDLAIEWFAGQGEERRALTLKRMRERARMELGQPARVTLDALLVLEAEADRLGFDRERVALLMMASQTHSRLGEQRTAERLAAQCVETAETFGDCALLADALNRLGNTVVSESPSRAYAAYSRAIQIFETVGDVRGQARSYGNLGIAAQFEARLDEAVDAYGRAIAIARSGGMPDIWGVAAVNLGVLSQKVGDYDRARELFGEALGLFAAVKHSEFQLGALYNMAHVERELGQWESAVELYEATSPLAQRIGQSDIEIGALAGIGICFLELDRIDAARRTLNALNVRMGSRPDWFQNRELVEAFVVRMAVREGEHEQALETFASAVALAESSDLYCAAWLTASCADALFAIDPERVKSSIRRYGERVKRLGYAEMTRRYDALIRR